MKLIVWVGHLCLCGTRNDIDGRDYVVGSGNGSHDPIHSCIVKATEKWVLSTPKICPGGIPLQVVGVTYVCSYS